jgi:hypothetical protein
MFGIQYKISIVFSPQPWLRRFQLVAVAEIVYSSWPSPQCRSTTPSAPEYILQAHLHSLVDMCRTILFVEYSVA